MSCSLGMGQGLLGLRMPNPHRAIPPGLGVRVRDGAQPLHALAPVQMTAGIDPDCFEAYLHGDAGGITSTTLVLHRVRLEA